MMTAGIIETSQPRKRTRPRPKKHFKKHSPSDVGKPKAEVAARAVAERVGGRVGVEVQGGDDDDDEMGTEDDDCSVVVTPHVGRIEDKPLSWYARFHVLVLGLDSLDARRHMNAVACSFLEFEEDGSPTPGTVKPVVDGGTDGFRGHVRVIYPALPPCFECTLWLFPPQATFPLCTLAETPRSSAHCVEWARLIAWEAERGGTDFDADVVSSFFVFRVLSFNFFRPCTVLTLVLSFFSSSELISK